MFFEKLRRTGRLLDAQRPLNRDGMTMQARFNNLVAGALLALAGVSGTAHASLLAGTGAYLGALNGVQNDQGTPPLDPVSFSAPSGAVLDKITWWGYRLDEASDGLPHADAFTVTLGSTVQTGVLTAETESAFQGSGTLTRYTLDVADAALLASSISIFSDADGFSWFWQGVNAATFDEPGFTPSFQLIGTLAPRGLPEPTGLALVCLAGLMLVAARRAR